jgi:hypothetical protein
MKANEGEEDLDYLFQGIDTLTMGAAGKENMMRRKGPIILPLSLVGH